MSAVMTLLIVALSFVGVSVYSSIAVAVAIVTRRRVMEVTCKAAARNPGGSYSEHLYCATLGSHWAGPAWAGALWPFALVPLLVLNRFYRDRVDQARIERLERELGMRR